MKKRSILNKCLRRSFLTGFICALCGAFLSCGTTGEVGAATAAVTGSGQGEAAKPYGKGLLTEKTLPKVYVTNKKTIHLLSPLYMNGAEDTFYSFRGTFGTETFHCVIYNQSSADGITLLVSNEFGLDMGTLTFAPGSLSFTSTYFPREFRPEYIVSDFQNASYDERALTENYAKAGLSFVIKPGEDSSVRRILSDKDVIEEITVRPNTLVVKNLLRGYSYILTKIQ